MIRSPQDSAIVANPNSMCSTPFGINDSITNNLRMTSADCLCAQRLSASMIRSRESKRICIRSISCAQRLSASMIRSLSPDTGLIFMRIFAVDARTSGTLHIRARWRSHACPLSPGYWRLTTTQAQFTLGIRSKGLNNRSFQTECKQTPMPFAGPCHRMSKRSGLPLQPRSSPRTSTRAAQAGQR